MSDFTIEQLEALKEGITQGERFLHEDDWGDLCVVNEDGRDLTWGDQLVVKVECGHPKNDGEAIAAIPALLDQLIAEKQAHAELRKRIEERIRKLKQPLCSHMPEGDELDDYLEQWDRQSYEAEILAEILEGSND